MPASTYTPPLDETLIRWIARIWAAALFLLWGAFFVEHLAWFGNAAALPPAHVFLLQACHLLLLVGLVIGWKWELAGGSLTVVSAALFFGFAAGSRALPLFLVTAAPAVLWMIVGFRSRAVIP